MRNRADLIGHVGNDPEIKTTQGGDKLATFRLATTERWKNGDGLKEERTEWHQITVWAPHLVDLCSKYIRKGSTLSVVGTIRTETYEKEGQKHYATKIVLGRFDGEILLLDKKEQENA